MLSELMRRDAGRFALRSMIALVASASFSQLTLVAAQDVKPLRSFLVQGGDEHILAFTSCDDPSFWHECVVFDLTCNSETGGMSIFDSLTLIREILESDWEDLLIETKVGSVTIKAPFYGFDVSYNDLDGGWIVELESAQLLNAFSVMRMFANEPTSITLGSKEFTIAPSNEDRQVVQAFLDECGSY